MNEAARLLRLMAPGSLFLLLYGVWFLCDSYLCRRDLPQLDTAGVALVAGSVIPLGFLFQVIAGTVTWFPWLRKQCWRPFATIDNREVSQRIRGTDERRSARDLVGIVDVWIHEAYKRAEHPHALNRLRSIADLYQGLAHGAVASLLAGLSAVATVWAAGTWLDDDRMFRSHGGLLLVFVGVSVLLSLIMCISHRRVVKIAEAMVVEILTPRWRR